MALSFLFSFFFLSVQISQFNVFIFFNLRGEAAGQTGTDNLKASPRGRRPVTWFNLSCSSSHIVFSGGPLGAPLPPLSSPSSTFWWKTSDPIRGAWMFRWRHRSRLRPHPGISQWDSGRSDWNRTLVIDFNLIPQVWLFWIQLVDSWNKSCHSESKENIKAISGHFHYSVCHKAAAGVLKDVHSSHRTTCLTATTCQSGNLQPENVPVLVSQPPKVRFCSGFPYGSNIFFIAIINFNFIN